jgi:hypothetical protein
MVGCGAAVAGADVGLADRVGGAAVGGVTVLKAVGGLDTGVVGAAQLTIKTAIKK